MSATGIILALDLASRTGWASGVPGTLPDSGCVILKKPDEPRAVACGNLIHWLQARLTERRPALVVCEAPFSLQAFASHQNAELTVRMTLSLHGIVEGMCMRHGIRHQEFHPATIRKHFVGKGRMGSRTESKIAVIQRCHLLGYMPKECRDDNRADALATWEFAAATTPSKLFLFGEQAA